MSPGGLETGRSVGTPEAAVRGPGGSVGRVTPGRSVGRTPRHRSKSGRKVDSRPRMHIPNVKNDWRSHLIPRNCSKTRKNVESRKIFAAPTARRVGRSATAGPRAAPRLGRSLGTPESETRISGRPGRSVGDAETGLNFALPKRARAKIFAVRGRETEREKNRRLRRASLQMLIGVG